MNESISMTKFNNFSKRFWSKFGNFSIFLFQGNQASKTCLAIFQKEKNVFSNRNKKFKKSKSWNFLVYGFGQTELQFVHLFILGEMGQKNVFNAILEIKKTLYQTIKTRSSKSRITGIFPKGLVHGFSEKLTIFASFQFCPYWARKMCSRIFQKEENAFLDCKKQEV